MPSVVCARECRTVPTRPSHLATGPPGHWLRRPVPCQAMPDSANGPSCRRANGPRHTLPVNASGSSHLLNCPPASPPPTTGPRQSPPQRHVPQATGGRACPVLAPLHPPPFTRHALAPDVARNQPPGHSARQFNRPRDHARQITKPIGRRTPWLPLIFSKFYGNGAWRSLPGKR